MKRLATLGNDGLGTQTDTGVEGTCPNVTIAHGMLAGRSAGDGFTPVSLLLDTVMNNASAPFSNKAVGQINIRLVLASDDAVLWGTDFVAGSTGYVIKNVHLRYQWLPDDGKVAPISVREIVTYTTTLDSNTQNISTSVSGLCSSVAVSFLSQDDANSYSQNKLKCPPPPGIPPKGARTGAASSAVDTGHYGVEKVYYALNDTETALVGFVIESREEILKNALEVFNNGLDNESLGVIYSSLIRRMNNDFNSDGYLAGIPFAGLVDLSVNRFGCELETECSNTDKWNSYFFFNSIKQISA
jgi:hypothetical protein